MKDDYSTRLKPGQYTEDTQKIEKVNKSIAKIAMENAQSDKRIREAKKVFEGNVFDRNSHILAIKYTDIDELLTTKFDYIPQELRNDFGLIHTALSVLDFELFGMYVDKFISPEKLSEAEFMLTMVKAHSIRFLNFADPSLTNSPEFMCLARDIERNSKIDRTRQVRGKGRVKIERGMPFYPSF